MWFHNPYTRCTCFAGPSSFMNLRPSLYINNPSHAYDQTPSPSLLHPNSLSSSVHRIPSPTIHRLLLCHSDTATAVVTISSNTSPPNPYPTISNTPRLSILVRDSHRAKVSPRLVTSTISNETAMPILPCRRCHTNRVPMAGLL